jgi:hypothetical protein
MPAIIFEDNNPLKQLTMDNASGIKKCKHFLMLIAYIKQQVEYNYIKILKIDTDKNKADILSKIVTGKEFEYKALQLLNENTLYT